MNVQQLLLLALVGPFCAFTHASPTTLPPQFDTGIAATEEAVSAGSTEAPKEDLSAVTGLPPPEPTMAFEEVATEVALEVASPSATVSTEEPIIETKGPTVAAPTVAAATAAPELLVTDPPAVDTAAPTEAAMADIQPVVTEATSAEPDENVVVENSKDEGLTSGQIVGIVIGALLAVVIVIAVVIAAVRRMGKYSP